MGERFRKRIGGSITETAIVIIALLIAAAMFARDDLWRLFAGPDVGGRRVADLAGAECARPEEDDE